MCYLQLSELKTLQNYFYPELESMNKSSQTWDAGFQTGNEISYTRHTDMTLHSVSQEVFVGLSHVGPVWDSAQWARARILAVTEQRSASQARKQQTINNRHTEVNDIVQIIWYEAKCHRKRKQKCRPGPVIKGLQGMVTIWNRVVRVRLLVQRRQCGRKWSFRGGRESLANSFVSRWLGLPTVTTEIPIY